ncbi:MAG: alpha amylase family protein [Bacteroidota bacterium]
MNVIAAARSAMLLFCCWLLPVHGTEKPKMMWFDATANFQRLSYPDSIRFYLDKIRTLGFTDVVVDIKPITGEVLYESAVAPRMKEWNSFVRPDFDFLRTFITETHSRSMRIHASMNVFVAGHNYFDRGVVYGTHPEWATIVYTDTGIMPITTVKKKYSAMTNPADPAVQQYELSILKEVTALYPDLDGIILDRVRFDGISADFSSLSRREFEKYIDCPVSRFPEDIFEWKTVANGSTVRIEGPHFRKWIEWRAQVIYEFIKKARQTVKEINPSLSFGDYTGAWYPLYYEMGVNWASATYDPSTEYPWATPEYMKYGYAELLDLYTTGNYFFEVTKDELSRSGKSVTTESGSGGGKEPWYSVEGSCEMAMSVTKGAVPVYGGIYVEQYAGHPEQFSKAVTMNLKKTDGLMVFDIVHIINLGWWNALEKGVNAYSP